jgi:hypothetical protein
MTDHAYALTMPFVTVTSAGGPHDTAAYVAGWQMGTLDAQLAQFPPLPHRVLVHADNRDQADLIAMRRGYRMDVERTDGDWATVVFEVVGL